MVDKNLFLHDLVVVAIMKNEGHYIKEWLDYHLLAGIDHFYIYDNESLDNQSEVVAPYVKAGLVDYIFASGKAIQMPVYNDAIKRFKFHCRYMAFIDGDEFIFPKTNRNIAEVVDEVLLGNPNAAGLAINWQVFGSNGQDKADYSCGVLERFTRRAPSNWIRLKSPCGNNLIKTIVNPRLVNFIPEPHFGVYFDDYYSVDENGVRVNGSFNNSVAADKIVINHYYVKSREEYEKKVNRGRADVLVKRNLEDFHIHDRNEVFDDGILRYRSNRAESFSLESDVEKFNRVIESLIENLSQKNLSVETALTCRALSTYLRGRFPSDDDYWKVCEKSSLDAILNSIRELNLAKAQLLLRELPELLILPYPAVKDLHDACLEIISQLIEVMHSNRMWKDYVELDYIKRLLQTRRPQ